MPHSREELKLAEARALQLLQALAPKTETIQKGFTAMQDWTWEEFASFCSTKMREDEGRLLPEVVKIFGLGQPQAIMDLIQSVIAVQLCNALNIWEAVIIDRTLRKPDDAAQLRDAILRNERHPTGFSPKGAK